MTHPTLPDRRKAIAAAAALACLALGAAGCSDDSKATPIPKEPQTTSTESVTAEPSDPVSSEPSWEDKYSANELVTYETALQRWTEYFTKINAIYKRGKDTPKARAAFQEYSMTWQSRVRELATLYDAGDVQAAVPPEPLTWRAISIKPDIVFIGQCTDYSNIVLLQHGKKVGKTKPDHLKTELVIEMDNIPGRGWMVANTELKDKKSCAK